MGGAQRYPSPHALALMGIASLHPSYGRYDFAFSRHVAPEVCNYVRSPAKVEGAGKTGCTLYPRSRVQDAHSKSAHEHTGSAEAFRPSLRSGFTAYFVLSPVNGSFATVAAQTLRDLTPAPRRQDHTTSPYASCAYVSRIPRPPHPTARS